MEIIDKINKSNNIWQILPELTAKELEKIIKLSSESYYNTDTPLISDEIFDLLTERLRTLDPNSGIFQKIGANVRGKKVQLPTHLGSMDKIKTDEKLIDKWKKEFKGPYLISDKLDGISCLLVFDPIESKNNKIKLYTRGDGNFGQDISHLVNLANMSVDKLLKLDTKVTVRGELIMSKTIFEDEYASVMSNARNMVAGIVNSKPESVNKGYAAHVDFVTYEVIEPLVKPSDQMKLLKKWGLNVVYYDIYHDVDLTILDSILQKRKKKSTYEIDGLIVTDDNKHARNKTGNPTYSFAYKGMTATANVRVIEVLWKPSKDGVLVPRIHFEKVRLSQADLEYTTAFNAKFIVDNKIGPGAIITIVRSGDVIPYIMGVVKPAKKPSLPDEDYEWDKNKVNIILANADDNETVIIQRLTKFVRYIGVDNLSEGMISRLVKAGFDTIPKLISITVDDLLSIDGIKETLANKLYSNIQNSLKNLNILTLMDASNIFGRGLGERKMKKILDKYPNIVTEYSKKKNHKDWEAKLLDLDGFDNITVDHFLEALPDFQVFYKNISKIINIKPHVNIVKKNGLFKDQVVCMTGFRNEDWKNFIEAEGGRVSGSVSKNTTLLIYNDGEESSAKFLAAKKLGIKTISKSEFAKKYEV